MSTVHNISVCCATACLLFFYDVSSNVRMTLMLTVLVMLRVRMGVHRPVEHIHRITKGIPTNFATRRGIESLVHKAYF